MNKYERALELISKEINNDHLDNEFQVLDELVDKTIPTKPCLEPGHYYHVAYCPCCNNKVEEEPSYCPKCGQALNWENIIWEVGGDKNE